MYICTHVHIYTYKYMIPAFMHIFLCKYLFIYVVVPEPCLGVALPCQLGHTTVKRCHWPLSSAGDIVADMVPKYVVRFEIGETSWWELRIASRFALTSETFDRSPPKKKKTKK